MHDEALETLRQECAELIGFANAICRSGRRLVYVNVLMGCLVVLVFGAAVVSSKPGVIVFTTCVLLGLSVDTFLSWRRLRKYNLLRFHLQRVMARDPGWQKHWDKARQLCTRL